MTKCRQAILFTGSDKPLLVFYRAMLRIRGTSHGPVSVCLSQVGVLLKRLNRGSHKQHHAIVQGLYSFLMPKISAKFDRGHPLRGRRMRVGWVKIGDFGLITGYISKTGKDRHIVSIKLEQKVVCALSNGGISHDLESPLTTPFSAFRTAIHSFVTGEPRDFVFGTLTQSWWRGTVVERRSLAGELSLSCARPAADG